MSNPDAASMSETLERNIFHRSAPRSVCRTGVMNDAAIADVDTVVVVERARSDEMRGERRFLSGAKQ
jgi:hypothetical protein